MSIGRKIKTLRKRRGITQIELANGIVSRSMLSRIESGTAEPSVSSLKAIAQKLDVSPGFLLDDDEDLLPAERALYTRMVFDKLSAGDYKSCLNLLLKTDFATKSDFAGVYVHCAFSVAVDNFVSGDFSNSLKLLDSVKETLHSVNIPLSTITSENILLIETAIKNIEKIDEVPMLVTSSPDFNFAHSIFMFLLKLLHEGRHNDCSVFLEACNLSQIYTDYIQAQMLIKDYKFVDAIIVLKNLASKPDIPVYLRLLCLRSIEVCCKLCEDYKGAYENHLKFAEVLNSIQR